MVAVGSYLIIVPHCCCQVARIELRKLWHIGNAIIWVRAVGAEEFSGFPVAEHKASLSPLKVYAGLHSISLPQYILCHECVIAIQRSTEWWCSSGAQHVVYVYFRRCWAEFATKMSTA